MSTKVSFIAGIGNNDQATAGRVPERRFINPRQLTDGELQVALMAEQMKILADYYQNPDYQKAEEILVDSLYQGVHGTNAPRVAGTSEGEKIARQVLAQARQKRRPAMSKMIGRTSLNKGIGDALIAMQDCDQYLEYDPVDGYVSSAEYQECLRQNEAIQLLNQYLEPSAHHLLYEYLTPERSSESPVVVQAKRVQHRNAVGAMSNIFDIRRDNIRLWLRNGVMRNNAGFGIEPLQPEQTIDVMATEIPNTEPGVNGFQALLPAIISAIAAAVGATATLISVLQANKRQQLQAAAQGIGTYSFGPEKQDWYGNGGGFPGAPGSGSGGNGGGAFNLDNNTLLLLAGAGFLLLNQK